MRRRHGIAALFVVIATTVAPMVTPRLAFACSCAGLGTGVPDPGPGGVVFRGLLAERAAETREGVEDWRMRFAVREIFAGDAPQTLLVRARRDGPACGITLPVGTEVVLVAREVEGVLEANSCGVARDPAVVEAWEVRARYPADVPGPLELLATAERDLSVPRTVAVALFAIAFASFVTVVARQRRAAR